MNNGNGGILMRMFGRPRGLLGRLGGFIMARMKGPFTSWVIGLLGIQPGDQVLEVGFGPGVALQQMTESTPAGTIAGVDCSPEMVAHAAARNAEAIQSGRIDLRLGSAEQLPFADETFERVISINSLQVWANPKKGLAEILRVMKANGLLALGFTTHARQPQEGLTELLRETGFSEAHIVDEAKGFCVIARKQVWNGGS